MMKYSLITYILVIINFLPYSYVFASNSDPRLESKLLQLERINLDLDLTKDKHRKIIDEYNNAISDLADKKRDYEKKKNSYERASKNVDLIPGDEMVKILGDYKAAVEANNIANKKEQQLVHKKKELELKIDNLKRQEQNKKIEILEIEATIFDEEMSTPVWAEGYGMAILAEDKSMNECKKMALEYAQRDAMEKGGKMIVETLTKMEQSEYLNKSNMNINNFEKNNNNESTYSESFSDIIKSKSKVQIVSQDTTNNFGKIIRIDQDDVIKFTVKVRLKLKSIDSFNPYRERIEELKKQSSKQNSEYVNAKQPNEGINKVVASNRGYASTPNKQLQSLMNQSEQINYEAEQEIAEREKKLKYKQRKSKRIRRIIIFSTLGGITSFLLLTILAGSEMESSYYY